MSDELPKGWATVQISDVIERVPNLKPEESPNKEFGYVDISSIDNPSFVITDVKRLKGKDAPSRARRSIRPNDILFSNVRTYLRNIALVGHDCAAQVCSTGFTVLRPNAAVEPRFLFRYVLTKRFLDRVTPQQTGTHYPATSDKVVMSEEIPLAPLPEQRRIVAKLETLLGKVDASQQRLAKIPVLIKRFRQSVLAAACSGRLTADWREENPADDTTEDDELARGWRRTTVEDLIPKGGIFDGPFGSNLKSDDYTESGVRVIRLENIGQLRFIGEKETFISREKYETLKRHTVGEGDIIFASFIMEEVRACVLPKLSTKAVAKADCFCVRPNPQLVDRQYLVFQLISQKSYNTLVEEVHGATRPRINTTLLESIALPLAPLPEQQEIVRRVEGLFALADQLEVRLAKARGQVEKLTPSLLARAFAGQLVPQDPTDEPAEKLLERIKTTHESKSHRDARKQPSDSSLGIRAEME